MQRRDERPRLQKIEGEAKTRTMAIIADNTNLLPQHSQTLLSRSVCVCAKAATRVVPLFAQFVAHIHSHIHTHAHGELSRDGHL